MTANTLSLLPTHVQALCAEGKAVLPKQPLAWRYWIAPSRTNKLFHPQYRRSVDIHDGPQTGVTACENSDALLQLSLID